MFKVQDAECFCCSKNHCHPETGEAQGCLSERWWLYSKLRSFQELGMLKAAFFFSNFHSFRF